LAASSYGVDSRPSWACLLI